MCFNQEVPDYDGWSGEQVQAEAEMLVALAAVDGSWRSLVESLAALRHRAELIEAHIAAVLEAIG